MSLLWVDGFDNYGTSTGSAPSPAGIVGRKYTVTGESSTRIRTGRLAAYSLGLSAAAQNILKSNLTTNDTCVIGFAIYFTALGSASGERFLELRDGSNATVTLLLNSSGNVLIQNNAGTTMATCTLSLATSTWYYFELKVKTNTGTSGTVDLRIGQTSVGSGSGLKTNSSGSNNYSDGFYFKGGSFQNCYIDDLYFLDSTGSINTTFLGNMRVATIRPDAAGDSTQFTPDSGSNYARVNEAICGDDSNYVEDTVSGHVDLYNYAALAGITSGIQGIMVCTDCRETDATSYTLKTECKSGSTTSDDTAQSIGTTDYTTKRRILEVDPNTSSTWTKTNLDAAQFGIKLP